MNSPSSAKTTTGQPVRNHKDCQVDQVEDQDGVAQPGLRDQPPEHGVRGVERPGVLVGVDAAFQIEVVVGHVVGAVGDEQPDQRQGEVEPVRIGGQRHGQQPADQSGGGGHRQHRRPGDDQPAADDVHPAVRRQVDRVEDLFPVAQQLHGDTLTV
jgi:hypothetical protein